jgi:hypothetical protein
MSINSIGGKPAYTTTGTDTRSADRKAARSAEATEATATIADHVAAVDEQDPIRSTSTTRGTLVDTYL